MALGAPKEVVDQYRKEHGHEEKKEDLFEVFPENWDAAQMFLRMSTQWNWAGLGERSGMNYQSLEFLLKLYPSRNRVKLFSQLQTMEASALAALREGQHASRNAGSTV